MAVYVNKLKTRFGSLTLCHLIADTEAELHAMAASIGIERRWFQADHIPHYDISVKKRDLALKRGAIAIDRQKLAELMARYRPAPVPVPAPESSE
jgi:hypothetical protein